MTERVLCRHVLAAASRHFGHRRESLRGISRNVPLTYSRHVAMYVARSFGHSFPKIGRAFNRDHHISRGSPVFQVGEEARL